MISSIGCARIASIAALNGSASPTSPVAGGAEVADELDGEVHADLRGVAHDVVVDHVAVARPGLRDDDEEARALLGPSPGCGRAAPCRRSSRWRG